MVAKNGYSKYEVLKRVLKISQNRPTIDTPPNAEVESPPPPDKVSL
jgi:hypothetical protein